MAAPEREPWLDAAAGRLVRPYTVCEGRTRPSAAFDLLTLVMATGRGPRAQLGPEHARVLRLCGGPVSVAEIAAHVRLPAVITKVVLSDLVDCGAVTARDPTPRVQGPGRSDRDLLEAVLHGLRTRL
ncbi:DUF742 domain-containing protein [Streptomyces sp. JJ38]|uniref:DUF742 domain-containing protein n=1 Tax=Streptomyces sp. JJ38 TaxID=2738128 RepID=UPI001C5683C8|nr:DUF742 domain-containing protein [Streptomyces sp. JJ38]MBW1600134.1 DUF742 domain-containing protein [Streptomyces sp. JJ38]